METFPIRLNSPDYGVGEKPVERMLKAPQGDGNMQRTPDGVDNVRRVWSGIIWERSEKDGEEIWAFLFPHFQSGRAFWWTPPGYSAPVKVWCSSVSRVFPGWNTTRITADFEEDFSK